MNGESARRAQTSARGQIASRLHSMKSEGMQKQVAEVSSQEVRPFEEMQDRSPRQSAFVAQLR